MQSACSFRSSLARFSLLSFFIALLASFTLPGMAQVAAQDAAPSSSSDVQTAQVVRKPKDLYRRDIAVSAFANYTNKTNGNFVRIDPTSAGGGMISYRESPRWWAGYEVNYGYTKYSETYNKGEYRTKNAVNEITAAYLIKPRAYFGIEPFLSVGGGAMIFSPSAYAGSLVPSGKPATQTVPLLVFSIGVQHQFTEHFGIRAQYRADEAKAPNFKLVALDVHSLRNSAEPALGIYYRF